MGKIFNMKTHILLIHVELATRTKCYFVSSKEYDIFIKMCHATQMLSIDDMFVSKGSFYIMTLIKRHHHDNRSVYCIPLTPHFYIEKLGFTGVYIFFLFLL